MFKKQKVYKSKRLKGFGIFTLLCLIIGGFFYLFNSKKARQFIKGEIREVKELVRGEEDLKTYREDSSSIFKDFFVPNSNNDHRPKALRPKALVAYIVIAVIIKLLVTGFLFFNYPNPVRMSEIISGNMIELIDNSRQENGVASLRVNPYLTQAAEEKAVDMMERKYFSHFSPEGKKPWEWIQKDEFDYVYAGENLAMDFRQAETVHDAFMRSPSHRKNILKSKYKEIGVAVVYGQMNDWETILLVEMFGTQRKDRLQFNAPKPAGSGIAGYTGKKADTVLGEEMEEDFYLPEGGVIQVSVQEKSGKTLTQFVVEYSNIFFIAFLVFILAVLMINIFIKRKVQHASLILQTIVAASVLLAFILVKFHFIEKISEQLLIL